MTITMVDCRHGVRLPSSHGAGIKRPRGVHSSRGSTRACVRPLYRVVTDGSVPAADSQVACYPASCDLKRPSLCSLFSALCFLPCLFALCSLVSLCTALVLFLHASMRRNADLVGEEL